MTEASGPGTSDRDLIGRIRLGDRASFEEVVLRYEGRVYAACRSLLRDREDAIDVAQETFLQAFLSIGSLKEEDRLAGWLCGIALTLCKARRRRTLRRLRLWERRPESSRLSDAAEPFPVDEWMDQLPEEQRAAVALRYRADLTLKEVAEAMGLPMTTAKRLVHQGLLALRTLLHREDFR